MPHSSSARETPMRQRVKATPPCAPRRLPKELAVKPEPWWRPAGQAFRRHQPLHAGAQTRPAQVARRWPRAGGETALQNGRQRTPHLWRAFQPRGVHGPDVGPSCRHSGSTCTSWPLCKQGATSPWNAVRCRAHPLPTAPPSRRCWPTGAAHLHRLFLRALAQAPHAKGVVALLDHQAVVPRQFGQRAGRAAPRQVAGQRTARGGCRQAAGNQVRRDFVAHAHVQVKPSPATSTRAVKHLQPHLQGRGGVPPVATAPAPPRCGQSQSCSSPAAGHAARRRVTAPPAAIGPCRPECATPSGRRVALFRHAHAAGGSVQQLHGQVFFSRRMRLLTKAGEAPSSCAASAKLALRTTMVKTRKVVRRRFLCTMHECKQ